MFYRMLMVLFCVVGLTTLHADLSEIIQEDLPKPGDMIKCGDDFYIHIDNNVWYELEIKDDQILFKGQRWKCPYCHACWEFGQKCQNSKCPTNQWFIY